MRHATFRPARSVEPAPRPGLSPEAIQASGAYATDLARKRTVSLIRLDATGGSR
jgi:hypothetical protein